MPYIKEGLRKELLVEPERAAKDVGAMNYLYTEAILKVWNAAPKYETIHKLQLVASSPNTLSGEFSEIDKVSNILFEQGLDYIGISVAYDLAFLEFYLRIGQFYEREKRQANGDLEGYEIAIKHLNEMARENFNSRIGYKEPK